MRRPQIKIAFIGGPADAAKTYAEWSGTAQQDYFGTNYFKQFLQLASDLNAESYVVTWHGNKFDRIKLGTFMFDNRPITNAWGFRYYLDHIVWHLRLAPALLRFQPDFLLLTGNQNFWWTQFFLRWFGVKLIVSYHAVLWPKFLPIKPAWRMLLQLNRMLILKHAKAIIVTSNDIRRQVETLLGSSSRHANILNHLPTYSPAQFADIRGPDSPPRSPFRVFFAGRIEISKGVYDLLEIALKLEREHKGQFVFDICGNGGQLERLRNRIRELDLDRVLICHGYSYPATLQQLLGECHACIVPTRVDCEAGFEMTCAEAILADRPLVTSAVCPALEYLRDASIEVEPQNVSQYCEAIVRLSRDTELYERKQKACANLKGQFYDPGNSWYAVMRNTLERHILKG